MNFQNFFEYKIEFHEINRSYLKRKWKLTDEFKRFIELEEHTDYLDGIFAGIIYVISEGQINLDKVQKYEKFTKMPLKGVRKVHVELPSIQSFAKNVCHDIEISKDGEIVTNDVSILSKYISSKNTSISETIFLKRYKDREKNNWKTGYWLIYAVKEDTVYFLFLDLRVSHKPENDPELLKNLLEVYSESYLKENFLK